MIRYYRLGIRRERERERERERVRLVLVPIACVLARGFRG